MNIVIVGAGVSGLTTAFTLEEAGFPVRVVAEKRAPGIVSNVAGAVWSLYNIEHPDAERWAWTAYEWLVAMPEREPSAGVECLLLQEVTDEAQAPAIFQQVPSFSRDTSGFPDGWRRGWQFRCPRIDPPAHLAWLERQLSRDVEVGVKLRSFQDLAADVIVNCTGLGSRELADDNALEPRLGQTVHTRGSTSDPERLLIDTRENERPFYVVPREECLLLGGTDVPFDGVEPPAPDAAVRRDILDRCRRAGFDPGDVVGDGVGLRPCRTPVRLEEEGRVIHNYGHGGAGFSVARGCAERVLELVRSRAD